MSGLSKKHASIIKEFKDLEVEIEEKIKKLESKYSGVRRLLSVKDGKIELGVFIDVDLL